MVNATLLQILTALKWVAYLSPIWILLIFIVYKIRMKQFYKYKVRIYKIRENGKFKEINCVGGYVVKKGLLPMFRIKLGRIKTIDLHTTPNPAYIDEEERVYYAQIDLDTYVQLKRKIEFGAVVLNPVESDIKYGALLNLKKADEVLKLEPTWKKVLPYVSLVILAIVFIVAYAILINGKCPTAAG